MYAVTLGRAMYRASWGGACNIYQFRACSRNTTGQLGSKFSSNDICSFCLKLFEYHLTFSPFSNHTPIIIISHLFPSYGGLTAVLRVRSLCFRPLQIILNLIPNCLIFDLKSTQEILSY